MSKDNAENGSDIVQEVVRIDLPVVMEQLGAVALAADKATPRIDSTLQLLVVLAAGMLVYSRDAGGLEPLKPQQLAEAIGQLLTTTTLLVAEPEGAVL